MRHKTWLSVLVLLVLVFVALAAQEVGTTSAAQTPAEPQAPAPNLAGWQYGPPSDFEYQRFDGAFVPGLESEPWANKIYFMGGRTSAPTESPDIWVFDPVTGVYTDTLSDMIEDVSNYNADLVLDDGTGRGPAVYVVGGYDKDGGGGGGSLGMVQRYYPQLNLIESLPAADDWPGQVAGYAVAGMGSVVVDDVIYVYGGWQSTAAPYFSTETWAFDPNAPSGSRWTNLGAELNPGRSYIQSAVQNGKIYAMGGISGYVGGDLVPTDVVEVLDTANLAAGWTALSPLPIATAEGRGFGFDVDTLDRTPPWPGAIYVVGGGDWPDYSTEAMEYRIGSDTWDVTFPDLNDGRVNHAGVFVPLCTPDPNDGLPGMWVFGGRSLNGCDPPYAATEFYALSCQCVELTDATIEGPDWLPVGETGSYAMLPEPPTATLPIDIEWSNGMTGTNALYGWDEPGDYTIVVTGTNCDGAATAIATLDVTVQCVDLLTATIVGPEELMIGTEGTYSVTLEPPTATLPIDVMWSNGTTGTVAVYSWTMPGPQTIVVTATNCEGTQVVDSFEVMVDCVELLAATIAGPEELMIGAEGIYSVTLEPLTPTLPIDIEWSNGATDTVAVYSWTVPGSYTVVVTATGCMDVAVVDHFAVLVSQPMHYVYLPLVVRDQ